MRTFIVLGVFALAMSAMAMTAPAEFSNQDHHEEALTMLVDLAKGLDETKQVENLLDTVKDKTASNRKILIAEFADITAKHIATVKRLKHLIKVYKAKIADLKRQIADTKARIEDAKRRIRQAEARIAQAKKDIIAENKRRARQHAIYVKKENDLAAGIAACGEALKLMAEFQKMDIGKNEQIVALKHSFIQTHSQVKSEVAKIRSALGEEADANVDVMFVEALVEAALNGVNDNLINTIITKIKDLQSSLIADRKATFAADAADLARHNKLIAHLNHIIKVNTDIVNNQTARLHRLEKHLAQLEASLKRYEHLLAETEAALKAENEHYAREKKRYTTVIKRLAGDVKAIEFAITYLESQHYKNGGHNLERKNLMKA